MIDPLDTLVLSLLAGFGLTAIAGALWCDWSGNANREYARSCGHA